MILSQLSTLDQYRSVCLIFQNITNYNIYLIQLKACKTSFLIHVIACDQPKTSTQFLHVEK